MKKILPAICLFSVAAIVSPSPRAYGQAKETKLSAFSLEQEIVLPGSPAEVYDVVTGDISPWWDHSFSQTPKKLYIEPRPGGGFYEIFNEAGDGILHATVIWAERGKRLRFSGPLVFSGRVAELVTTYDLKADPSGTRLHLTVNFGGQIPEGMEKSVDEVWHHFLFERLKPYLESPAYQKRKASMKRQR
jgi:uncharacterized protein YndB with AHSA1/START domain